MFLIATGEFGEYIIVAGRRQQIAYFRYCGHLCCNLVKFVGLEANGHKRRSIKTELQVIEGSSQEQGVICQQSRNPVADRTLRNTQALSNLSIGFARVLLHGPDDGKVDLIEGNGNAKEE